MLFGAAVALAGLAACKPEIGDKCVLSTDCSTRGDRLCDTSQPDGYCTQFNCRGNGCPAEAACVLFNSAIPGCGFDDRAGPGGARSARSFCVVNCKSNGDCRDGYVCVDPRRPPWSAFILDNEQAQLTCLARPFGWDEDAGVDASSFAAPVCGPVAPEAGTIDARPANVADAAVGTDASDGGLDASDAADGD
jgi:hypothetical protein